MNKNESAWETLFAKHDILNAIRSTGKFVIRAEEINTLRESRLMTKFDHRAHLPDIFTANKLAILPITRGSYVIGHFDAYASQIYDPGLRPVNYAFPAGIESLDPNRIYSEAAAINCAYASGMIDDIAGEKTVPTISGRMGTSSFDFEIGSLSGGEPYRISVENSQCEIDGGFEGPSTLIILEAKSAIAEDFIIRQLYYPVRLWHGKVLKKVVPVFLSYSNDVFHFFIYEFSEIGNYNSLNLVGRKDCVFTPEKINLADIRALLDQVQSVPEPEQPFPQADKFVRIVDLLAFLANGAMDGAAITLLYDFDPRQTAYYASAGKYLGLVEGGVESYALSESGARILKMSYKMKYLALAKAILAHEVFHKVCRAYFTNSAMPSVEDVVSVMKTCGLHNIQGDSTYWRRARTIIAWVDWIIGLADKASDENVMIFD